MGLLQETKELCNLYHIKPAHAKGQNFLINKAVYEQIVAAADLQATDTVLEIGPGLGFLTFALAAKVKQVAAVELDKRLAEVLKLRLAMKEIKNVEVVQGDILDNNVILSRNKMKAKNPKENEILRRLVPQDDNFNYKIVANLPYNITSIFLRKFLAGESKPSSLTLMLQKEVAERIVARAGDMSLLALSVQFFASAKIIAPVAKRDFWPSPEVDSAIIHLQVSDDNKKIDQKLFFRLAKIGFSAKRKMLKNNLANGLKINTAQAEQYLTAAGLKETCRAQDLGLDDWLKLFVLINHKSQISSSK